MADLNEASNRTTWQLTLLFFPAACLGAVLSLISFTGQPAFFLVVVSLYFAHRVLFAGAMIGLSLRQLLERAEIGGEANEQLVSVAIAAHNEADLIVDCVRSVAGQSCRPHEIIIINDGSTDQTLQSLIEFFALRTANSPTVVPEEGVNIYRSPEIEGLIVIDKPRGGKAEALNTALTVATGSVFVTVDGDTLLAPGALARLVAPFERDSRVIAAGGTVKPGNGIRLETISRTMAGLPLGFWARIQWIEYAISFFGRFGWMRINSLVSMSGCFTAFNRLVLKRCGGFDGTSLADDYEIAYRLHAHHLVRGIDYKIISVADALALTIVPQTARSLFRQRRRWSHGCFQTLLRYRHVAGRPRFRGLGIFLLPFKFFVAAENCWGIAMLPLSIGYLVSGSLPVPPSMLLQLLALKLGIDIIVCCLLQGLHQRHIAPRLTQKSLFSQMALAPVYVIAQQFLVYAYIAGVVRALKRGEHQHGTDSYAAAIHSQYTSGRKNAFSE